MAPTLVSMHFTVVVFRMAPTVVSMHFAVVLVFSVLCVWGNWSLEYSFVFLYSVLAISCLLDYISPTHSVTTHTHTHKILFLSLSLSHTHTHTQCSFSLSVSLSLSDSVDGETYSPLHVASKQGHTAIIVALVEEGGADVNVRGGEQGDTPLMLTVCACSNNSHTIHVACILFGNLRLIASLYGIG